MHVSRIAIASRAPDESLEDTDNLQAPGRRLRSTLLSKGVLEESGPDEYRLVEDYVFSSPSNAAGVLCGASVNGRPHWRDAQGRTLKAHQEAAESTFDVGS